jgi:hypothetical protein
MPTKDSADKLSNPMVAEGTRKTAAFSSAAAWRHGPRPGLWPEHHPNRLFRPVRQRQSSTRLEPNSSSW